MEQTCIKDGKQKNPTKITKTEPREQKLAVSKTLQSSRWKLATVIDVTDKDIEVNNTQEPIEEVILVKVKDNPKRIRQLKTLKKKYLDVIKETIDLKAVFNKVIKQLVTIKLQDLLACSPTFAKLLFKGVSIQEAADVLAASIGSVGVQHKKERTYTARTPKLLVKVNSIPT